MAGIVLVTLVPSVVLATQLVRDEWFSTRANRYLAALEASQKDTLILAREVDPRARRIRLALLGVDLTPEQKRDMEAKLAEFGLADAALEIRQPTEARREAGGVHLARAQAQEAQRKTLLQLDEKTARVAALEQQINRANAEVADHARLAEEIHAQLPAVRGVTVARPASTTPEARRLMVALDAPRPLPASELARLKRWLGVRLPDTAVEVIAGKAVD
jgi:hypothetical protein